MPPDIPAAKFLPVKPKVKIGCSDFFSFFHYFIFCSRMTNLPRIRTMPPVMYSQP